MVICAALPAALSRMTGPFQLALLDPPYEAGELPQVLARLARSDLLTPDAVVVAEHRASTALPDCIGRLAVRKRRRHGDAVLTTYRFSPSDVGADEGSEGAARVD